MSLKARTLYLVMVILISVVTLLYLPVLSRAETVTARLYQPDDSRTFIEINLTSPAPPTLIVEMRLPPGSQIIRSTPHFSKQNKKNNTIKWLFKNVTDSSLTIELVTGSKLDLGSTSAHVRYRSRDSGTLKEVQANKAGP